MTTRTRGIFIRAARVIVTTLIVLVVVGSSAVMYTGAALPDANDALRSDARVRVVSGRWIEFFPEPPAPGDGTLRPPGSPTGPVTLRLAFFDIDAAVPVQVAFPDVPRWAVGGHSLGGVAAAWYARDQTDRIAGLVLWAAYTDDGHTLAPSTLPVLSVSGTRDGNVTPARIAASRLTLPSSTRFVAIEGANHAQFGAYRYQMNDADAAIGREEQHRQIAAATVAFLDTLGAP